MLVRGQFVTCVFALHAPVRSSVAILPAPHRQPPNQWNLTDFSTRAYTTGPLADTDIHVLRDHIQIGRLDFF